MNVMGPPVFPISTLVSRVSAVDVVLIDGGTASGKSYLARALQSRSPSCTVLSHDQFLWPRKQRFTLYDQLRAGTITPQQYQEGTWDMWAVNAAVDTLLEARRRNATVRLEVPRLVDRERAGVEHIVYGPDSSLLIEGVGAMGWNTGRLRALRIWCESPSVATTIERKLNRPGRDGMTDDEVRRRYMKVEKQHDDWNESIGKPLVDCIFVSRPRQS